MNTRLGVSLLMITSAVVGVTTGTPADAAAVATVSCSTIGTGATVGSAPLANFDAITPRRLVDTRIGLGVAQAAVGDGCTLRLDVGAAGVPAEADALALSITALGSRPGFLSVFPCSSGRPETSNINTRDSGFPTPGLVVAIPDAAGEVCIYTLFAADLIVDLTGWWTADGDQRFTSISPVRVDDTREQPGRLPVPAGTTRSIPLGSHIPADATAVVGNLTVTESAAAGFITAFPCGSPVPNASNLNFRAGEARAVAIAIGVGTGASLCVYSNVATHVILDVSGFYSPAPQFGPATAFEPVAGRRLADSRTPGSPWTTKFASGTIRRLEPTAGLPIASQATAVLLNIVATQADEPGFVTVYPCDAAVPNSSALNYTAAGESTNMVAVELSPTGEVCVFTRSGVHLVVDLFGVMRAPDGVLAERLSMDGFTWPPFTPTGSDYAVECGVGPTDLRLDLLRSTTARVNGVPVGSGTIDLPTSPDELVWVQLRRASTTANYYFRCVPDDFPRLKIDRPGSPAPGWYLTTFRTPGDATAFAVMLDNRGAPVWYKRLDRMLVDMKRRSDGRIILAPELGPRYGVDPDDGYRIMNLGGTFFDEHRTVADPAEPDVVFPTDHHDYVELPGGARAMLSYPLLPDQDLTVLGEGYLADDVIADGVIQEIGADDQFIWSWRTSDYFGYDEVPYPVRWPAFPNYTGGEVDVFHLNSLGRVEDGSGDYVVSARHLDAVFRVDRSTGDVDWIVGSLPAGTPNKSNAQRLTIVGDPHSGPRRPHDARLTGDVLTLFDNRTDTGEPARAVAYRIDTVAGTATMIWQIEEPQGRSSMGLGSNRVAADGSVLVGWGAVLQPMFEEFDADGNSLMRITQVTGGSSYRIVKEPLASFSATVLRATAGGTVDLP